MPKEARLKFCNLILWKPLVQWVQGVLTPGFKRLGREADHSHLSSAEVKKAWTWTSTPPKRIYDKFN